MNSVMGQFDVVGNVKAAIYSCEMVFYGLKAEAERISNLLSGFTRGTGRENANLDLGQGLILFLIVVAEESLSANSENGARHAGTYR